MCKYCTYCKFCKVGRCLTELLSDIELSLYLCLQMCDYVCDETGLLSTIAGGLSSVTNHLKDILGFEVLHSLKSLNYSIDSGLLGDGSRVL